MINPEVRGKVQTQLRTTLVKAEERISKAAETISVSAKKLAGYLAEKRNGNGCVKATPKK